ncbi:Retrovirus-related Pol polyprotein from transposon RE1 [Cardamine amara subsp. amara]|uniref:Retrovirus-related Pol polyprotein from transposon RE1 n=1 Tax=Cardamine amara subsp. amara TaxID=228776 RepID=A0ABD1A970_CARAN
MVPLVQPPLPPLLESSSSSSSDSLPGNSSQSSPSSPTPASPLSPLVPSPSPPTTPHSPSSSSETTTSHALSAPPSPTASVAYESMGNSRLQAQHKNQAQQAQFTNQATTSQAPSNSSAQQNNVAPVVHPPEPEANNTHRMTTRGKSGIVKSNPKYSLAVTLANSSDLEPQNYRQALKDKKWRHAMSDEFDAQIINHSWDLVPPPPPSTNVIGCK